MSIKYLGFARLVVHAKDCGGEDEGGGGTLFVEMAAGEGVGRVVADMFGVDIIGTIPSHLPTMNSILWTGLRLSRGLHVGELVASDTSCETMEE